MNERKETAQSKGYRNLDDAYAESDRLAEKGLDTWIKYDQATDTYVVSSSDPDEDD